MSSIPRLLINVKPSESLGQLTQKRERIRFVSFRFVSFRFVSFRFVSHRTIGTQSGSQSCKKKANLFFRYVCPEPVTVMVK
jgi:hypothetical protein